MELNNSNIVNMDKWLEELEEKYCTVIVDESTSIEEILEQFDENGN